MALDPAQVEIVVEPSNQQREIDVGSDDLLVVRAGDPSGPSADIRLKVPRRGRTAAMTPVALERDPVADCRIVRPSPGPRTGTSRRRRLADHRRRRERWRVSRCTATTRAGRRPCAACAASLGPARVPTEGLDGRGSWPSADPLQLAGAPRAGVRLDRTPHRPNGMSRQPITTSGQASPSSSPTDVPCSRPARTPWRT